MVVQGIFLFGLAAMIHLILLSSVRYNWLDGLSQAQFKSMEAKENSAMPPSVPAAK
jgi:light-harvesting complex 1 alpha chain